MRWLCAGCALIGIASAVVGCQPVAAETREVVKDVGSGGVEQKLLGTWRGGACVGTLTFRADGTFERQHYTPGNNKAGGAWTLKQDATLPILAMTYTSSDFRVKDPTRRDVVGDVEQLTVTELTSDSLGYRSGGSDFVWRFSRQVEK